MTGSAAGGRGASGSESELFERYYDRVLAIVRRRLGSKLRRFHESGDLVQEAMLHAVRDMDRAGIRGDEEFVSWMAGIVENRLRDLAKYHGAQKRDADRERRAASLDGAGERDPLDALARAISGDSPPSILARDEQRAAVAQALASLEPERRALIERRGAGDSWASVAKAVGAPSEGAARMQHARAMVQLVRAFERIAGEARGDQGADDDGRG